MPYYVIKMILEPIPNSYVPVGGQYSQIIYPHSTMILVLIKHGSKTIKDLFCLIMLSKIIYTYIFIRKLFYYIFRLESEMSEKIYVYGR